MNTQDHWENVYSTRAPDQVSWFRPHLETSLSLIERSAPNRSARIIDVGGGESTLVDDLLARGYSALTLLDISETAIDVTKARLGSLACIVEWLLADVTTTDLPANTYDIWHDRAVFHFLTSGQDRGAYVERVRKSVKPGGHVIIGTFGPEGAQEMQRPPGTEIRRRFASRRIRKMLPSARQHQGTAPDTLWDYSAIPLLSLHC